MDQRDDEEQRFLRRHGAALGAGTVAVVIAAIAVIFFLRGSDQPPTRKVQEVTLVKLLPPPPPPPPPPPQQQPPPKMVEQPQMKVPELKPETPQEKPKEAPPKAEAPPPGPLGLDAKGEGPGDSFNLAGNPGGNGLLGGGGGGGSRWGWYVSQVQTQIEKALRQNPKTRNSQLQVDVLLWLDASGRIDRVQLTSSTGSAEIDAAIKSEVLTGMQLSDAPPKDMPLPIVTRVTARRPS